MFEVCSWSNMKFKMHGKFIILLDNVLHALRALRPCDPHNSAMVAFYFFIFLDVCVFFRFFVISFFLIFFICFLLLFFGRFDTVCWTGKWCLECRNHKVCLTRQTMYQVCNVKHLPNVVKSISVFAAQLLFINIRRQGNESELNFLSGNTATVFQSAPYNGRGCTHCRIWQNLTEFDIARMRLKPCLCIYAVGLWVGKLTKSGNKEDEFINIPNI